MGSAVLILSQGSATRGGEADRRRASDGRIDKRHQPQNFGGHKEHHSKDRHKALTEKKESERVFEEDLSYLLDENKGRRAGLENYQKLKELEEKRKIEDLEVSLISSKKSLNARMIEMQKLNETMKQEESFDAKLDQDLQDVQDQVKLYNEIHARLQWETNEILMKKKFLNNEIQNFKGNIRVHVRLRDFLDGENKADYVHVDGYKNINLQVPQKVSRFCFLLLP